MANLTITVDEETLKRARVRAIERGESVNQYLADRLREYADDDGERARRIEDGLAGIVETDGAGSCAPHGATAARPGAGRCGTVRRQLDA